MKKKISGSPYSMMYLVTPAIYEKLLLCIDEGDKKIIDSLNRDQDAIEERRPAQVLIDSFSSKEIKQIPAISVSPVSESVSIPQVTNVPVVNPSSQQVPVAVTVHPQDNVPVPLPSIPQTQPVIIPPVQVMAPIKPMSVDISTDLSQPAVIQQPIAPVRLGDASHYDLPDYIDEEEDYSSWQLMDDESRGIKRPLEDYEMSDGKKFRPNEIFKDRDERYRQGMLARYKDKKDVIMPQSNPLSQLPRNKFEWQPIQCVDNTTGGQLCNTDSAAWKPKITVRKDLFARPNTCHLCGVRLGNAEMLQMHMRIKHKQKGLIMPGLEENPPLVRERFTEAGRQTPAVPFVYDPNIDVPFRKKSKKKRFMTPGNEPPVQPLVVDPSQDVPFRTNKIKKKKRFSTPGNEPPPERLQYDSTVDVPFRTVKKMLTKRKTGVKEKIFRCPICQAGFDNISSLKEHIGLKHKLDPKEVFEDMANNVLAPPPGTSRDFTDWSSIRVQPTRAAARRQRFGQLKKETKEFSQWK